MTAKEKAKELYWNFYQNVSDTSFPEETAKKLALIAVDEIIDECGNWIGGTNDGWDTERFDYWQEVKEEIEKL